MASLTNLWLTVPFLLRAIREQWAIQRVVHSLHTGRFLLRVTPERWAIRRVARSCRSHSNRNFSLLEIVKLPGDRVQNLEPGNAT
jgi:hypothetical protein